MSRKFNPRTFRAICNEPRLRGDGQTKSLVEVLGAAQIDALVLAILHKEHQPRIDEARDRRVARMTFVDQFRILAEDGKIAVIESGMDCDCVTYDGRVHIIDATLEAFDELHEDVGQWADGLFSFRIERPSVARKVRRVSRDNVLEAYEDGHPHAVVARMPEQDDDEDDFDTYHARDTLGDVGARAAEAAFVSGDTDELARIVAAGEQQ